MNNTDKQYIQLLQHLKDNGVIKEGARDGMPSTKSIFGYQMRFNVGESFPLLTTKKMAYKTAIKETLFFLRGLTNVKHLVRDNVGIWNDDAYRNYTNKVLEYEKILNEPLFSARIDDPVTNTLRLLTKDEYIQEVKTNDQFADVFGDLQLTYGYNWRNFNGTTDQLLRLINDIKVKPFSRRHIVSAWNPTEVLKMALPACHTLYQFNVRPFNGKLKLDCQLYQRSGDCPLGIPINIVSYSLILTIISKIVGYEVGEFIHTLGDCHFYTNQEEGVVEQLARDYNKFKSPKLELKGEFNNIDSYWVNGSFKLDEFLDNISLEDFNIIGYESYPAIKFPLSVGI
jgi:thymidylate synthase